METVIQKYLRNQYKTIEEYNAQAGEVAEPYRVLVVANFPANFTPEAAERLVSIASSGAVVRRLHARQRRHRSRRCRGTSTSPTSEPPSVQPRLEGRRVRAGRTRTSRRSR